MDVKVSIICITYNHADYIERAIEGFLMQQTDFEFEILIRDDCSTDGTTDILKRYEAMYPGKIHLIIEKENQYSKGIKPRFVNDLARGEYCAICEGDDYWTDEHKLQLQVDYMDKNPECSFCFHKADEVSMIDGTVKAGAPYKFSCRCDIRKFVKRRTIFETCTIMYRRELTSVMPAYHDNAPVSDLPLILHLMTQGYGYYMSRNMAVHLFMVPGSWSATHASVSKSVAVSEQIIDMYHKFDTQTKYLYHASVESEICRRKFLNALLEEERVSATNILRFSHPNLRIKVLDVLQLKYPQVYGTLLWVKGKIRNILR